MIGFLLSCAEGGSGTAHCADGVLVGSACEDFSTAAPRAPHVLDGGFPTTGDTEGGTSINWLANSGFEEGVLTTPWDPTATPPAWTASGVPSWLRTGDGLDPGAARSGQAVVELGKGDGLDQAIERLLTFDDRYVVRAWMRADEPADAEVSIRFLDASQALLSERTFPVTAWPDWRAHALGSEGPGDMHYVTAVIRGTGGVPVWFDDVRLELASTDPVTFDLSAPTHSFEGFGAQASPYAADAALLSTMFDTLGLRFVRVDPTLATADDLLAVRTATGKAPWLLTASVPAEVTDLAELASFWVDQVQTLHGLGIAPDAIDLAADASGIDAAAYASLVAATRKGLDDALFPDVEIAAPGTRTLLGARDAVLALGSDAPLGAWSFQAGDDGTLCTGGAECLAMGWDEVEGVLDAIGGTAGRPIWLTHLATAELTFLGETWPSPDADVDLNATGSAAYAVRVVENALVGIASGAARVYFWYAVDDAWGLVDTKGDAKPVYGAVDLVLEALAEGADVVPSPDQTGRSTYTATFVSPEQIVVVATNEAAERAAIEVVLEGASGKEVIASSKSFARYVDGDPETGTPDASRAYDVSIEAAIGDGKIAIEAELLPVSVTVLVFDRGA